MAIFFDQPATGPYTGEKTFFGGFPLTRKLLFLFTLCFALAIGGVGALADNPSVNINTDSAESLSEGLVGVGLAKAYRIVEHREAYGPFESVEELVEVKGIGEATVEKNRARIILE